MHDKSSVRIRRVLAQTIRRPCCGLGEDSIVARAPRVKLREKLSLATVAHRNGHVAQDSLAPRALERRTTEDAIECRSIHLRKPLQRGID
jgi:hypothetical protein